MRKPGRDECCTRSSPRVWGLNGRKREKERKNDNRVNTPPQKKTKKECLANECFEGPKRKSNQSKYQLYAWTTMTTQIPLHPQIYQNTPPPQMQFISFAAKKM